jgi:hypothetical protein
MNEAEIIDGAIEIIQKDGLHRGYYIEPTEGQAVCALGAMNRSYGVGVQYMGDRHEEDWSGFLNNEGCLDEEEFEPLYRAKDIVRKYIPEGYGNVANFNDDESNSVEDILLVFKNARASLDTTAD